MAIGKICHFFHERGMIPEHKGKIARCPDNLFLDLRAPRRLPAGMAVFKNRYFCFRGHERAQVLLKLSGRDSYGRRVFQTPIDPVDRLGSALHDEFRNIRQQIVDVVDDRNVSVFLQKSVLRCRNIALTPDVSETASPKPPDWTHLPIGKLIRGYDAAREQRTQKRPDPYFAQFRVR